MDLTNVDKATLQSVLKEWLMQDKSILKEVIKELLEENEMTGSDRKEINLKKFSDKILSEDKALLQRLA